MRNFSNRNCKEYQNTRLMVYNLFFPENSAVYDIL